MSRETRPTKMGSLVDSGEEEIENDLVIWTPKEFQIKRVRENIVDSDRVSICTVPEGANIFTGKNIPDNALVISSHHLRFLRFPLHPLFQILWRVLGLHPMQLNSNSYMLLSGLLVMGKRWEASLGLGDFFYFHRLAHIAETTLYFNFTPRPLRKVFDERASNFSNWKSEPLMVLGDWAAPEIPTSIPKAFSERAEYVPTSVDSLSSESRIKWLRDHVLSRGWNAAQFASKADLDDISHPRTGAIYSSRFQVLGDDLSGEALFRCVIELESKFTVSEHTPTLFAESFKAKDLLHRKG